MMAKPWSEIKHKRTLRCNELSPIHKEPCIKLPGHTDIHTSASGISWGYSIDPLPERPTGGDIPPPVRHTRPLVDQGEPRLYDEIFKDDVTPVNATPLEDDYVGSKSTSDLIEEFQSGLQKDAVDTLTNFIHSHINAMKMKPTGKEDGLGNQMYAHTTYDCPHCDALEALEALQEIIKGLDEDVELRRRSQHNLLQMIVDLAKERDEAKASLRSCTVELHDQKRHELGLMCADQEEKLNKIKRAIRDPFPGNDAHWLAAVIEDILEGIE